MRLIIPFASGSGFESEDEMIIWSMHAGIDVGSGVGRIGGEICEAAA